MTETEIRVAIAEARGWKWNDVSIWTPQESRYARFNPMNTGRDQLVDLIPDYLSDLNAMHEAEKSLPAKLLTVYDDQISALVLRDCKTKAEPFSPSQVVYEDLTRWKFHATARQRAEAFLKCIGKWAED